MIHYRLLRTNDFGPRGIAGEFYRMDELICFTLEPPKHRATHPAIPEGTYNLLWSPSPRLHHFTPRLVGVPDRTGILIHAGNKIEDTEGCILVGYKYTQREDGTVWLERSRLAKEKVYQLIARDLSGGYADLAVHST